ncbi:Thioesterase superfamily [Akanthomyces lecanii RCEF 1005]|uniref:Thioesterase superfamily n=1 Tax=Akanthomyces lecanii RCEF 1005 TaxID=1081108 RepID=A0A162K7W5_CORDF|nr:Thioesterase superfamily [Akanthomyces lecanii RCEF 1005]
MAKKLSPLAFTQTVRSFHAVIGVQFVNEGVGGQVIHGSVRSGAAFRVTSAAKGKVDFELDIHKDHTNRLNTIHGGTLAAIVDLGGSLAVSSHGRWKTGVSTDINISYLNPGGKPGDILKGVAVCDKIGKTLAYTTVHFFNSKGQLAARGSHTKFVAGTDNELGDFVVPEEFSEVD